MVEVKRSVIETKGKDGQPNGWLLPLWNATERPDLRPEQVYLTVIAPGKSKGPHLHMQREQRFYLVRGSAAVLLIDCIDLDVTKHSDGQPVYKQTLQLRSRALQIGEVFVVRAGEPMKLVNCGREEAWIINMPSPAWTPDNPDDWPVVGWPEETT